MSKDNKMPSVLLNLGDKNTQQQPRTLVLDDFETRHSPSVTLSFMGCPCRATEISLSMDNYSQMAHTEQEKGQSNSSHVRKRPQSQCLISSLKSPPHADENTRSFNIRCAETERPGREVKKESTSKINAQHRSEESVSDSNAKGDIRLPALGTSHVNIHHRGGNGQLTSPATCSKLEKLNEGAFMADKTPKTGSKSSPPNSSITDRSHVITPRKSTSSTSDGSQRKKSSERGVDGKMSICTSQRSRSGFRGQKHKSECGRFIDDVDGTNAGYLNIDHLDVENMSLTIDQLFGERSHGDSETPKSPPKVDGNAGNVVDEKETRCKEQCVIAKCTPITAQAKPEDPCLSNITRSISSIHKPKTKQRSRNHPATDNFFIDVMKLLVTQSDPKKPCHCQEVSPSYVQLGPSTSLTDFDMCSSHQQFDSRPFVNSGQLDDTNTQHDQTESTGKNTYKRPCTSSGGLNSTKAIGVSNYQNIPVFPRRSQDGECDQVNKNSHNHIDEEQTECGDFWGFSDSENSSPTGSSRQSCGSNEDVEAHGEKRLEEEGTRGRRLSVREMVKALQERLEATAQPSSSGNPKRALHPRNQSESSNSRTKMGRKYTSEFNDIFSKQPNLSTPTVVQISGPGPPTSESHSHSVLLASHGLEENNHVEKSPKAQEKRTKAALTNEVCVGQSASSHVTDAHWQRGNSVPKSDKRVSKIPIKRHIAQLSKLLIKSGERIRNQFTAHSEVGKTHHIGCQPMIPAENLSTTLDENLTSKADVTQNGDEENLRHLDNTIHIIITPPSPASVKDEQSEVDEQIIRSECNESFLQIPATFTFALSQHPEMALMEEREQQMLDNCRNQMEQADAKSLSKSQQFLGNISPALSSIASDTKALLLGKHKSLSSYLRKATEVLAEVRPAPANKPNSNDQMKRNVCGLPTFFQTSKSLSVCDFTSKSLSVCDLPDIDKSTTSECYMQRCGVSDLAASCVDRHISGERSTSRIASETQLTAGDAHPPIFCLRIRDISHRRENVNPVSRCDPFRDNHTLIKSALQYNQACSESGLSTQTDNTATKSRMLKQQAKKQKIIANFGPNENNTMGSSFEKEANDTSLVNHETNKINDGKLHLSSVTEAEERLLSLNKFVYTEENSSPDLPDKEEIHGVNNLKKSALSHMVHCTALSGAESEDCKPVLQTCASCSDCKRDSEDNSLQDEVSSLAPIKSLSLVNAADAGHTDSGVTDVMTLLSLEVNIKRYPSFPDLTDISDENDPLDGTKECLASVPTVPGMEETSVQHNQFDHSEHTLQLDKQTQDRQDDTALSFSPYCQSQFILPSIEEEEKESYTKAEIENSVICTSEKYKEVDYNAMHSSKEINTSGRNGLLQNFKDVPKLTRIAYSSTKSYSGAEYQPDKPNESNFHIFNSADLVINSQKNTLDGYDLPSPPNHSLNDSSWECDHDDLLRDNSSLSEEAVCEMQAGKGQSTFKTAELPEPLGDRIRLKILRGAIDQDYCQLSEDTSSAEGLYSLEEKQMLKDRDLSQLSQILVSEHTEPKAEYGTFLPEYKLVKNHGEHGKNKVLEAASNILNNDKCSDIKQKEGCDDKQETQLASVSLSPERSKSAKSICVNKPTSQISYNSNISNPDNLRSPVELGGTCCKFNDCAQEAAMNSGNSEYNVTYLSPRSDANKTDVQSADDVFAVPSSVVDTPCTFFSDALDNQAIKKCPKILQPRKQITWKDNIIQEQQNILEDSLKSSEKESASDRTNSCLLDEDSEMDATEGSSNSIAKPGLAERYVSQASSSGMCNVYPRNMVSDIVSKTSEVQLPTRLSESTTSFIFREGITKSLKCDVNNNVSGACSIALCGDRFCKEQIKKQANSPPDNTLSSSVLEFKSSLTGNYMTGSVSKIIGGTDLSEYQDQSHISNANPSSITNIGTPHSVYSLSLDFTHARQQNPGTESTGKKEKSENSLKSVPMQFTMFNDHKVMAKASNCAEITELSMCELCSSDYSSEATPKVCHSEERLSHCNAYEGVEVLKSCSTSAENNSHDMLHVLCEPTVLSCVNCDLSFSDAPFKLKTRISHTQRIGRSGKDITKAFNFLSRSQKHLKKCDQIIHRSSDIVSISQEMVRNAQQQIEYTAQTMSLNRCQSIIS